MKTLQVQLLPVLFCLVFGFLFVESTCAQVDVREGAITIPTYPWTEDVNPKFWALEGAVKGSTTVKASITYPYTMQDHLSRTIVDRTYRALFLENEYLKITCLPELGGRLHSVLDKTQNQEMFHLNRVIKPSMIAMRGAFISGGVEWNAGPQVHTVTILSPVDALIGKNPDGSAYLEVSNLEKSLRTQWTVRVTLHPGRSYLDERIRIFNPIDAISPYYFWNCTAYPCRPGTRFIYPMTLGTDHNGVKFFSWPIHEGKDLSWLKNYEDASSIFAYQCAFDSFGAYDVQADRGVVQVADHYELSGKKAWTWGQGEYGRICQRNLTDEDGAYIEVQSGPLPTQSDYGMLAPRAEVAWQEWWYPVHGLGEGYEYATKDIAVQTNRNQGKLELRIMATGKFPAATCAFYRDNHNILEKQLDLSPDAPAVLVCSQPGDGPVEVTVKTAQGQVLASFITPLPVPKVNPPDLPEDKPDEQMTIEQLYLKGEKLDRATQRNQARSYYEKVLAQDPLHRASLRALAVLDYEAGLYEKAVERLQMALKRKPDDDGLCWYFLGASQFKRKNFEETLRCAYQAARCFGTNSIGYDLAGRAYMQLAQYQKAADAFAQALRANPNDTRAQDCFLLAQYALGNTEQAWAGAQRRIRQNPTDLIARALPALQNQIELEKFARESRAYVGEDDFEMIETSLVFAEMNLFDEAARLLAAACVEAVPQKERSPLPLYYLAYFASRRGDEETARNYLSQAAAAYKDFIFPSRPEAVEVFRFALGENPDDAYGHLHLGNVYGHLGRLEEAVIHWRRAVELDASLSVALRNLGLYYWSAADDLDKAAAYYRQAIAARPTDQTLYRDLAEILVEDHQGNEAVKLLETMPFEKIRRSDIIILLAQTYLDEQKYNECLELLSTTPYFVNWEGSSVTWVIFHKAHLERGQQLFEKKDFTGALQDFEAALTYPENLGVGRPNYPQAAPAQYWRGQALQALSRLEEARSAWKAGAEGPEGSEQQNKYRNMCQTALDTLS